MIHICSGWGYWTIGVFKIKLCMIFGSLTPSLKISVSNVKLRLLLLIMFILIRIISNVTIWCYRSITLQFTHIRMLLCNRLRTVTLAATTRTSTRRLVKSWGGWRRANTTRTSTSRETSSSAPSARGTSSARTSTPSWIMPNPPAPPALMWEWPRTWMPSWLTTRPLGFTSTPSSKWPSWRVVCRPPSPGRQRSRVWAARSGGSGRGRRKQPGASENLTYLSSCVAAAVSSFLCWTEVDVCWLLYAAYCGELGRFMLDLSSLMLVLAAGSSLIIYICFPCF